MLLSVDEIAIKERADAQAREMKTRIAKEMTDKTIYLPDEFPVSVFMAGSPGAGKTESSRNLIARLTGDGRAVLRIDTDELRSLFSEYNGHNSHLFMSATSFLADKIHDLALKNGQSFVFDGTLSNIKRSRENIERSLSRIRFVQIVYVYQDPLLAWSFVKAREAKDGRAIPKSDFIAKFFAARENVDALKKEFGDKIRVDMVVKNIDGSDYSYSENIDVVDSQIFEKYTKIQLEGLID